MRNKVGIETSVAETKFPPHFLSYRNRHKPNPDQPSLHYNQYKIKTQKKEWSKEKFKDTLYPFNYTINKPLGKNGA